MLQKIQNPKLVCSYIFSEILYNHHARLHQEDGCTIKDFFLHLCVVSGDANFEMERTALVVGGSTQPVVAKTLKCRPVSRRI